MGMVGNRINQYLDGAEEAHGSSKYYRFLRELGKYLSISECYQVGNRTDLKNIDRLRRLIDSKVTVS